MPERLRPSEWAPTQPGRPPLALVRAALTPLGRRRPTTSPAAVLRAPAVRTDVGRLRAYERVCGFAPTAVLPITYAHVLAFGLNLRMMTRGDFPFALPGLVHLRNVIMQRRPLRVDEELSFEVSVRDPVSHPRGATVDLITDARVDGDVVWSECSTYLRRDSGRPSPDGAGTTAAGGNHRHTRTVTAEAEDLAEVARWQLGGDLGRRYARVSGDWNPIHLSSWTARPFGFRGAIAHGMWATARSLAGLSDRLPDACTTSVQFSTPILLPTEVALAATEDGRAFEVRRVRDGRPHLAGTVAQHP